jgi:arylsulfatase A-like enzyme
MAQTAQTFIGEHDGAPWLLWVATNSPHTPAYAAERYQKLFRRTEMPNSPSFNETDVSDKPAWVRSLPLLDEAQVGEAEELWRQKRRSLRSVDDLIGSVIGKLEQTGQLENTYIVFTSDNGYLLYKHRVRDKGAPYEEAIRLPFVVRGPGVPQGASRSQLVANTDLAPTIADWAGVEPPGFVDGRSFAPLLSSERPPWRKRLLIEYVRDHPFFELRTSNNLTYTEYETGEREFYDLKADPYQLDNSYPAQDPLLIARLSAQLEALKGCVGEACRVAEGP